MRRSWGILAAAAVIALAPSCGGYYSTKGRTAGDIRKISVPNLSNETAEPDVEITITENLRAGLIKDNTLKVVAEQEADAVFEATVVEYRNVPYTFSTELQADQYRLTVVILASLFNPKENEYVWKDRRIEAHSEYYLETETERTYDRALEEVYKDLVEGILNATTQEW